MSLDQIDAVRDGLALVIGVLGLLFIVGGLAAAAFRVWMTGRVTGGQIAASVLVCAIGAFMLQPLMS